MSKKNTLRIWSMTVLRMGIGWHFLYEGLWKFTQPSWSSVEYLRMSRWIGAPLFKWIADNPTFLNISDHAMMWGLTLIGLGLVSGVFARAAAAVGIVLMAMFYVAQPPFLTSGGASHFMLLDYNVIESLALVAVVFDPGAGLWEVGKAIIARFRKAKDGSGADDVALPERRELIAGLATVPVAAAFGGAFVAKHGLGAFSKKDDVDAQTSASYRFKYQTVADLKKPFAQKGKIKGEEISRVIMGGNLIGGWAHSRDLQYVSTLMKAYNTPRRIFDSLHLGEACGFDTILTNPSLMNFITRYWKEEGGTIKFISDCGHPKGPAEGARLSVDNGACMVYLHGFGVDRFAVENDWKGMEKELKEMRKLGVPVGIGAHAFSSVKFCVEHDFIPDFWMKTFHPTNYWSERKTDRDAGEGEPGSGKLGWSDNCWCRDPEALAAWFEKRPEPWIAFKIMAAGAVPPKKAMPFAFNHGADFVCMGMFDFQTVENANLANELFDKGFATRKRPWRV